MFFCLSLILGPFACMISLRSIQNSDQRDNSALKLDGEVWNWRTCSNYDGVDVVLLFLLSYHGIIWYKVSSYSYITVILKQCIRHMCTCRCFLLINRHHWVGSGPTQCQTKQNRLPYCLRQLRTLNDSQEVENCKHACWGEELKTNTTRCQLRSKVNAR